MGHRSPAVRHDSRVKLVKLSFRVIGDSGSSAGMSCRCMRARSVSLLHGFALVELTITAAIMAILGTIALSSYAQQAIRSNRFAARSLILGVAGQQEQCSPDVAPALATSHSPFPVAPRFRKFDQWLHPRLVGDGDAWNRVQANRRWLSS